PSGHPQARAAQDGRPTPRFLPGLFRTVSEPAASAAQRRGGAAQHRGHDPAPHLEGAPSEDLLHGRARPGRLPQALVIFSPWPPAFRSFLTAPTRTHSPPFGPRPCITKNKTPRRALP